MKDLLVRSLPTYTADLLAGHSENRLGFQHCSVTVPSLVPVSEMPFPCCKLCLSTSCRDATQMWGTYCFQCPLHCLDMTFHAMFHLIDELNYELTISFNSFIARTPSCLLRPCHVSELPRCLLAQYHGQDNK